MSEKDREEARKKAGSKVEDFNEGLHRFMAHKVGATVVRFYEAAILSPVTPEAEKGRNDEIKSALWDLVKEAGWYARGFFEAGERSNAEPSELAQALEEVETEVEEMKAEVLAARAKVAEYERKHVDEIRRTEDLAFRLSQREAIIRQVRVVIAGHDASTIPTPLQRSASDEKIDRLWDKALEGTEFDAAATKANPPVMADEIPEPDPEPSLVEKQRQNTERQIAHARRIVQGVQAFTQQAQDPASAVPTNGTGELSLRPVKGD